MRRMIDLLDEPPKKWINGGFQDRKVKWAKALTANEITLDDDDIDFIRRQIINKHGGGWQMKIAEIFEDKAPQFHGLPIKPKKR